ncbi:hypothetical protein B0H14DRAFT_2565154 [Mycena olivaceomarginata]|nr:hypothetical protein B0H14DRAFT_2565154 [Mycena olivaceomarginata]
MPVVIEGARPIHAAEQKMVLDCFEESRIYSEHQANVVPLAVNSSDHAIPAAQPESKFLADPSTIDTVHDLEAAVRDLNQLIELMNIMDPEELSQSSSLISHVQGLPNSFNFPEDIGDVHYEDQVPKPEHPAEDGQPELSFSHPFDFCPGSGADSVTGLYLGSFLGEGISYGCDSATPKHPTDPNSGSTYNDNFDEDMCTLFDLYTEHSEYPELRAKPKQLASSFKRAEAHDDPPSYQESVHVAERSFAYSCPKIRGRPEKKKGVSAGWLSTSLDTGGHRPEKKKGGRRSGRRPGVGFCGCSVSQDTAGKKKKIGVRE